MSDILSSDDLVKIAAAIDYIECVIDDIDELNDDVQPFKDVIAVSKERYKECFPENACVLDTNATIP